MRLTGAVEQAEISLGILRIPGNASRERPGVHRKGLVMEAFEGEPFPVINRPEGR